VTRWARYADHVALATVVALLALSPWPLGSRPAWASMLCAAVVIVVGALWLAARLLSGERLQRSTIMLPIAAFLAWTGLQWAMGWTAYRHATAYEWVRYLSYALTFVMALHLAADRRSAKRLQWVIIGVGIVVGVFGLVQFLTWNGRLFWLYEPALGGIPFGPFNNRNYFAGYLVATLPLAIAALLCGAIERRRWLLGSGLWLSVLALLASLSRGGLIALSAAAFFAWIQTRPEPGTPQRAVGPGSRLRTRWATGLIALSLVAGLFWISRADLLLERLEAVFELDAPTRMSGRLLIWGETLPMALDRPVTGFGLNTYAWVYPAYRRPPLSVLETNAHNEYLEMLVETGIVGAALCAWFLVLLLRSSRRRIRSATSRQERGLRVGALAAWVGILVYGLSDFPTIIPAINYALAVAAALATAERATGDSPR